MPKNTDVLTKAVSILTQHGVTVTQRPGWQTRQASTTALVPQAVVVHHTGDASTPLGVIEDGRTGLPGPLANFLVGQSGTIYLCAAGYTNNAGYGGEANFAKAAAGKLGAEVHPPASDGKWSANRHAWSIEGDGAGRWGTTVYDLTVKLVVALHMAHGWTSVRVIAHKELTRRKVDPGNDMGTFRADVAALLKSWSTPATPPAPPVVVVPPAVTPPPVAAPVASLLLGIANCQSYDGDKSAKAWTARGLLMKAQGRNAWSLCETSGPGREVLLAVLGKTWREKVLGGKTVAVLYDSAVFSARTPRPAGPWAAFGQGSIALPLYHIAGKFGFDLIAHQTRPGSVATDAQKDHDIAEGAKLAGTWPAVFAGDFNRNDPKLPGWVRVLDGDTLDAPGVQRLDAAFTHGELKATHGKTINPGPLSDHKWRTVDLTPAPASSL